MMKYLLARIRYLYAIAAAVFGICATFMLYYRPRSVWGRWYLIVTIIMVVLCFDATLKARNAMKAGKAAGEAAGDSSEAGEDDTAMGTGADTNADAGVAENECGAADDGDDASMPAEAVGDSVSPPVEHAGEGSADIASHGREKQAIENENGDETEAEDTVRTVHHPQERLP